MLEIIPLELFSKITYLIGYKNITSMICVCRKFNEIYENSLFWQCGIQSLIPIQMSNLTTKSVAQLKKIYKFLSKTTIYLKGNNKYGQLGDPCKYLLKGNKLTNFDNVTQISCGNQYTAFITDTLQIYTFGRAIFGKLGHGDGKNKWTPTPIPGFKNVIQVSCGFNHAALITNEGTIYTFGRNNRGQLGLRDTFNRSSPTQIPGYHNVVQVACGGDHTAFVTSTGHLYTFGNNHQSKLGIAKCLYKYLPVKIEGFNNVRQVACGREHTAFITETGHLYIFGDNKKRQCGIGNIDRIDYPTRIGKFNNIIEIHCGSYSTIFTDNTGITHKFSDMGYTSQETNQISPFVNIITLSNQEKYQNIEYNYDHIAYIVTSSILEVFWKLNVEEKYGMEIALAKSSNITYQEQYYDLENLQALSPYELVDNQRYDLILLKFSLIEKKVPLLMDLIQYARKSGYTRIHNQLTALERQHFDISTLVDNAFTIMKSLFKT